MHIQIRLAPATVTFDASWPSEPYQASGATPLYTGADVLAMGFDAVELDVRYVFVVATAP